MRRSLFFRFLTLAISSVFLITGCTTGAESPVDNGKIQVTATTGMVADTVAQIGKEHVMVTGLMGPGVDPHLYKASQGDIKKLDDADLIFYNGLFLEGKLTDILTRMARTKPVIPVAEYVPESKQLMIADGHTDPHIWFDVSLWMKAAERVRDGLIEVDPKNKNAYEKNASIYLNELKDMDTYVRQQMELIPKDQRVLITAHDAFGYFGKAYNIEVVGLQGISTASEYGLKDVQKLVDLLTERKIKAVFVESSVPKRSIEAVVQGAKERNHQVKIGGQLYSDAMGTKGTPEGTYLGMVRHNVDTIVNALK